MAHYRKPLAAAAALNTKNSLPAAPSGVAEWHCRV
jgi:hypothetical protein